LHLPDGVFETGLPTSPSEKKAPKLAWGAKPDTFFPALSGVVLPDFGPSPRQAYRAVKSETIYPQGERKFSLDIIDN
jgi:hypothetical protein